MCCDNKFVTKRTYDDAIRLRVQAMSARRLEDAAAAAGFAMVNPEDFAHESAPSRRDDTAVTEPNQKQPAPSKSWLNWDYARLTGGKAPA